MDLFRFLFPLEQFSRQIAKGKRNFEALFRNYGRDPFNQNSNRSDREKRTTSKGGPVFSKLFRLDRTDPLSFGPKFPEILVEWIAPYNWQQRNNRGHFSLIGRSNLKFLWLIHRNRRKNDGQLRDELMFVFLPFQTTDSFVMHRKLTLSVRPWEIREFKKLRRQLQWNRDIKIELCVKLSLLRLFHVDHVVQNWRSALSLAWHERFSCRGKDWKIYCCELVLSSEPQIWKSHVVVCQTTSKHCTAPKSVPHVQHDYFSSFNQSNHWFVALELTLLPSNLNLPIVSPR